MSKNANSKNRTQNTYNSTNETDRTTSKNAYDSKNTYDKTTSKNYAGKSSYDKNLRRRRNGINHYRFSMIQVQSHAAPAIFLPDSDCFFLLFVFFFQ